MFLNKKRTRGLETTQKVAVEGMFRFWMGSVYFDIQIFQKYATVCKNKIFMAVPLLWSVSVYGSIFLKGLYQEI